MKENIQVQGIRTKGSLYCSTGIENNYRRAFLDGQGGSRKETTWDRGNHEHACCKSKVPWRHRVTCPRLQGNEAWKAFDN